MTRVREWLVELTVAVEQFVHHGGQFAAQAGFRQNAVGSCQFTVFGKLGVEVDGHEQNLNGRKQAADFASRIESVHIGHPAIEDDEVGLECGGLADGFAAIGGFPADFVISTDDAAKAGADYGMVINDQNALLHRAMRPRPAAKGL